jgi:hypothetical protein
MDKSDDRETLPTNPTELREYVKQRMEKGGQVRWQWGLPKSVLDAIEKNKKENNF